MGFAGSGLSQLYCNGIPVLGMGVFGGSGSVLCNNQSSTNCLRSGNCITNGCEISVGDSDGGFSLFSGILGSGLGDNEILPSFGIRTGLNVSRVLV
jgi:hypothetical protein